MQGLLAADVIGFHTLDYVRHFRTAVRRVIGVDFSSKHAKFEGRQVTLLAEPLGIDPEVWELSEKDDVELAEAMQSIDSARKGK